VYAPETSYKKTLFDEKRVQAAFSSHLSDVLPAGIGTFHHLMAVAEGSLGQSLAFSG